MGYGEGLTLKNDSLPSRKGENYMRKILLGMLIGSMIFSTTPVNAEKNQDERWPCAIEWWKSVENRERLIRCEYERINPPGKRSAVLANARCESGETLMDTDTSDIYGGPYQQDKNYWTGRREHYRRPSDKHVVGPVTHFRSNVIISFRMAKQKGTWRNDWPHCSRAARLP